MTKEIQFNPNVDLRLHKWNILMNLWSNLRKNSLQFIFEDGNWVIRETIDEHPVFQLRRNCVSLNRYTDLDVFGLLGLSLINLQDKTCVLTEGVSDYISAKLCLPDRNVLGVTTLGGSKIAKKIIVSLFDDVLVLSDKDSAGLNTAYYRWKSLCQSQGVSCNIWRTSSPSFKDITDEFIFNLKLDSKVQF